MSHRAFDGRQKSADNSGDNTGGSNDRFTVSAVHARHSARRRVGDVIDGGVRTKPRFLLRLRSAEDQRLWRRRRNVQQEANGAEQGHALDQSVSRRPTRHRGADLAEGTDRRHRLRADVDRQCLDGTAGVRRVLAGTSSSATKTQRSGARRPDRHRRDEGIVRRQDERRAHDRPRSRRACATCTARRVSKKSPTSRA